MSASIERGHFDARWPSVRLQLFAQQPAAVQGILFATPAAAPPVPESLHARCVAEGFYVGEQIALDGSAVTVCTSCCAEVKP